MLICKIYLGFTYDVTRKAYKASYIEDLWTTICFDSLIHLPYYYLARSCTAHTPQPIALNSFGGANAFPQHSSQFQINNNQA